MSAVIHQLGALIAARRLDEAVTVWRDLIRGHILGKDDWLELGRIGLRLGQPEASDCLVRSAQGNNDPVPLVLLALCRFRAGDRGGALVAARQAFARAPSDVEDLLQLGAILGHCDAGEEALESFRRAAALAPADPRVLYNLATAQRANGQIDLAEQSIDTVIRINPGDGEAQYLRAGLRTQTETRNHVRELQAILSSRAQCATHADVPLHFALGKELDDLGRHYEAFEQFAAGNRLRRSTYRYDVHADIATIDSLVAHHTAERLGIGQSGVADNAAPIFIAGLPRSGTTLVERILAGHRDVTAGGELEAFAHAAVAAVGPNTSKAAFVERSLDVSAQDLGRAYLDRVGTRAGATRHFTDKLPINALYAGLIARALPAAKIILVTREPMASGFAMFSTLFANAYPFSCDLAELGCYIAAWQRMTAHWREALGPRVLILSYEELVADPDNVVRTLLQFCDLDWDPGCLDFHHLKGSVSSASAVQIRQPLHRKSVAKWRSYEEWLAPLASALDDASGNRARYT